MIRVLLFAGLAEAAGSTTVTVEMEQESVTVEDVKGTLSKQYPKLKDLLEQSMAAVNQEYADANQVLTAADEIAFIPPVSGG